MGKRSSFERIPRDFYPTPHAAVPPLLPYLRGVRSFAEPCCGDGALVRHLESYGLRCVYAGDIATGQDALALTVAYGDARRDHHQPALHAPADARTHRALRAHPADVAADRSGLDAQPNRPRPSCRSCTDIVSVGRLRWFEGTKMSGKENSQWYRFDARHAAGPIFHAREISADVVARQSVRAVRRVAIGHSGRMRCSAHRRASNAHTAGGLSVTQP